MNPVSCGNSVRVKLSSAAEGWFPSTARAVPADLSSRESVPGPTTRWARTAHSSLNERANCEAGITRCTGGSGRLGRRGCRSIENGDPADLDSNTAGRGCPDGCPCGEVVPGSRSCARRSSPGSRRCRRGTRGRTRRRRTWRPLVGAHPRRCQVPPGFRLRSPLDALAMA